MKIEIGRTNGRKWCLEFGNSRFGIYNELKDLFKDLEIILNIYKKKQDEN